MSRTAAQKMRPSLYDRLGGSNAVVAAVDLFYQKVLGDERINHFFANVDMSRQAAHQLLFLTYAFGGAKSYAGKPMREAHKHLDLKEEHFTAAAECLHDTLEELGAPADLIDEVMEVVASTHDDVLNL